MYTWRSLTASHPLTKLPLNFNSLYRTNQVLKHSIFLHGRTRVATPPIWTRSEHENARPEHYRLMIINNGALKRPICPRMLRRFNLSISWHLADTQIEADTATVYAVGFGASKIDHIENHYGCSKINFTVWATTFLSSFGVASIGPQQSIHISDSYSPYNIVSGR